MQASREEKARRLRFSGWFEQSPAAVESLFLAAPWELFRAEPEADFIRPGHDKRFLAVILKGFVRVFRSNPGPGSGGGHAGGWSQFRRDRSSRVSTSSGSPPSPGPRRWSEKAFMRLAETQPLAFRLVVREVGRRLAQCLHRINSGPLTVLHPMLGEEPNATVPVPESGHALAATLSRH